MGVWGGDEELAEMRLNLNKWSCCPEGLTRALFKRIGGDGIMMRLSGFPPVQIYSLPGRLRSHEGGGGVDGRKNGDGVEA